MALLAALASRAGGQTFNPGDVFWASSFTPAQLLNVTGGGNFAGATPLATLAGRSIGQIAWSPNRATLYVTLFALDRVDTVTTSGAQSVFATGLSGPTGLLTTRDGRLLVANFASGTVVDITGGGNFSGAPAFATGLSGPRNLVQLADDRILIAAQSSGRVIDITAGGNFAADPGFAFGLSAPLDLVQNASGHIFVSESSSSQVTDITAGGNFTGVAPFAFGRQFAGLTIDGSARLLANNLVGTNAWDITLGGNFSGVSPWAFNLPTAETAFDTVPPRVCGDGQLDPSEQCDDGNNAAGDCCSPSCQFEAAGAPCPNDGQVCTLDQCNAVGVCTHPAGNSGATCRPIAGACDVAETCNGISPACPSDVVMPSGSGCRAVAGICDVAESCNGVSPLCPSDGFQPSGFPCRAAAGLCDAPESCTGMSPSCPGDARVPSGTECRAAVGLCDAAEICDGVAINCPADGLLPSGSVCRGAADLCDAVEHCDGMTTACPPDVLSAAGTPCRAAAGVCDLVELCTGASASCPPDGKSTSECRAAGPCDLAESCTGVGNDCPADVFAPDGADCSDGAFCNGSEQCQAGVCGAASTPCAEFCDENGDACVNGCPPAPQPCRMAARSLLKIRNGIDPSADKLLWKWIKGAATQLGEIGDPTTTATYALCLYGGTPVGLLAGGELLVPAGANWTTTRSGYRYKDKTASVAGVHRLDLKVAADNASKALLKGKGDALPDPTLPIADAALPLTVQLLNTGTTVCWESTFGSAAVTTNSGELFKARVR